MSESTNDNENPTFSSSGEKPEEKKSAPIPVPEIKRYQVLKQIAEGGMGVVYLAEQQHPIQRKVAIKAIKKGMDSKNVLKRFELERQTLALLNHPSIAQIFDAGITKEGRSYFVMEYVEGEPITEFCDKYKLSIENRLKLFLQVCDAIQYAHQKGIIHRDIKPSNILVAKDENKVVLKVIDFGIAKAVKHGGGEQSLVTQQGQLVGTPAYMSPEQAGKTEEDIDTRTDIYSLGVLLYELLTGTQPFDQERLQKAALFEILKVIQEEDPPRPSTRLSGLGDTAIEMAQKRRTEVMSLARLLKNELEWIPIMAMRKERDQRYQTASEFASDIKNYLKGNPLLAGPETNIYKIKKFVRRNKTVVVGAFAILMMLMVGIVVFSTLTIKLTKIRDDLIKSNEDLTKALARAKKAEMIALQRTESLRRSEYCVTIALAHAAYQLNNINRVYELLKRCPKDLRGWEWYYLAKIMNQAKMTLHGNQKPIRSVSFSPDRKYLAAGGDDKLIYLWDVASGTLIRSIGGDNGTINSVAYSPDGKYIASAGNEKNIKIWDALEGKLVRELTGHSDIINSIAYSKNGNHLISGSHDKTVKVWNPNTGEEITTLDGLNHVIFTVVYSPNNKLIAAGGTGQELIIWDVSGDTFQRRKPIHTAYSDIRSIAFSPDGKQIVCGKKWITQTIILAEDVESENRITEKDKEDFLVHSIAISNDGKYRVSGYEDGLVRLWDQQTGKIIARLRGHVGKVFSTAFSNDGTYIVSGGEKFVKIWDLHSLLSNKNINTGGQRIDITSISISPNSENIAIGGTDEVIRIVNAKTFEDEIKLFSSHHGGRIAVAYGPNGKRIVSGGKDNLVILWDTVKGTIIETFKGHTDIVEAVAFSSDGKYIASGSKDGNVIIWKVSNPSDFRMISKHNRVVRSLFITQDNKRLISADWFGQIKISDIKTGQTINTYEVNAPLSNISLSPDEKYLASSDHGVECIRLRELDTGKLVTTYRGQGGGVTAFSLDGKRLISCDGNKLNVLDVESGNEFITLSAPISKQESIFGIYMSPDGNYIVGGGEGIIGIWRAAIEEDVEMHMPELLKSEAN
jgi:eukaryotic-like serine/threonine-protein kinase